MFFGAGALREKARRMDGISILLLLPVIFGGVGAVFTVYGIASLRNTRKFLAGAQPATGTVTDVREETRRSHGSGSRGSRTYRFQCPVVRFRTQDGREIEDLKLEPPGSWSRYEIGQEIDLLYDPLRPEEARIKSSAGLWLLPIIFTAIGSVFVLVGAAVGLLFALLFLAGAT
jgi:hypothetical protein